MKKTFTSLLFLLTLSLSSYAQTIVASDDIVIECGNTIVEPSYTTANFCSDPVVVTDIQTTNQCGNTYTQVITFTATDDCGNTDTDTQTITVVDTTPPVVIVPVGEENITATEADIETARDYLAGQLTQAEMDAYDLYLETLFMDFNLIPTDVTDNCDTDLQWIHFLTVDIDVECPLLGILTCNFYAVDACGNVSDTVTTVANVVSTEAPVIQNAPPDITLECGDLIPTAPTLTATDDSNNWYVTFSETISNNGDCPYTITRTWTAHDDCENTSSVTQIITVTSPDILGCTNEDACNYNPEANIDDNSCLIPTGCDECLNNEILDNPEIGESCDDGDPNTIEDIYITCDICAGTTPAVLTVGDDMTIECGETIPEPSSTTSGFCPGVVVNVVQTNEEGCGNTSVITYTYLATDECNNGVTAIQVITIVDTTAPAITCPADVVINCDDENFNFDPSNTGLATASDNCSTPTVTYTNGEVQGPIGCTYTMIRTWTAVDECGNASTCDQLITITDNQAPTISVQATVTINCTDSTDPTPDNIATVLDGCDDDPNLTYVDGPMSGDCPSFVRTWTAIDSCGNTSTEDQTVLIDDTPILVSTPENVTIECDETLPTALPVFTNSCGGTLDIVYSQENTGNGCPAIVTFTAVATNGCGNSTQTSWTVTINDTTPPVFDNTPESEISVDCNNIPDASDYTATDNCTPAAQVTITSSDNIAGAGCAMVVTRTYTATDNCGNTTTATQIINVVDNTPPTLIGVPADITTAIDCSNIPEVADVTATDNCEFDFTISFYEEADYTVCPFTITRHWTAIDACGNLAKLSQTILVNDVVAPSFGVYPLNINVDCDQEIDTYVLPATDNCDSDVTITFTDVVSGTECPYVISRTWTATDDCGNSVSADQTFTVGGVLPPAIYPNPSAGNSFQIKITDLEAVKQLIVVQIIDPYGKIVLSRQYENNSSTFNQEVLLTQKLSTGQYLIRIQANDSYYMEKLVVE